MVDGHALTTLIYKTLERVDTRLDTLRHCETRVSRRKYGSTVRFVLRQDGAQCRSSEAFCRASSTLRTEESDEGVEVVESAAQLKERQRLEVLCRMTYWAMRCRANAFALNRVFFDVLQALRAAGYKQLDVRTQRHNQSGAGAAPRADSHQAAPRADLPAGRRGA